MLLNNSQRNVFALALLLAFFSCTTITHASEVRGTIGTGTAPTAATPASTPSPTLTPTSTPTPGQTTSTGQRSVSASQNTFVAPASTPAPTYTPPPTFTPAAFSGTTKKTVVAANEVVFNAETDTPSSFTTSSPSPSPEPSSPASALTAAAGDTLSSTSDLGLWALVILGLLIVIGVIAYRWSKKQNVIR